MTLLLTTNKIYVRGGVENIKYIDEYMFGK